MNQALIADDPRAIRGILRKILISNGLELDQACDGLPPLAALEAEAANSKCLCTDNNVPEISELALSKKIRIVPRFESLPVIMIATETHLESMQAAFKAGTNEYVIKPFTAAMAKTSCGSCA